ncbi:MAG: M3 family oligoendopeptidase [Clostridiaceae bacterium]|nr:M3 family oligoendopeptidase [Clostridiaceae bacterium]
MQKFHEIEYVRPDLVKLSDAYLKGVKKLEEAKTIEEAKEGIRECEDTLNEVYTLHTIAYVRNTMNTQDEFYEKEIEFFNNEYPKLIPLFKQYRKALLDSRFREDLEKEFGKQLFRLAEVEEKTQDEAIVDDLVTEANLGVEYQKIAAGCSTEFMGETCNFYGLLKHMQNPDRKIRKEAYLAWAGLYEGVSQDLDRIFDELVKVRVEMAKKLGFDNYTALGYLNNKRLDYTREDVEKFRQQVKKVIVPMCKKIRAEQAKRIDVDKIKYYDESFMFPEGNPQPVGNKDQMIAWAQEMYNEMSKETGEFFNFMVEYDLFDLETRPGKHLGGYCTVMPVYKAPFIFSNFNGTSADVDVLTHEAGHSFQYYVASRTVPLDSLSFSTNEINEVHSMTMEYFAYPWMDKFFGDKTNLYKYYHLCENILFMPYIVCVDEFQHRIYDNPSMTADERYQVWKELEKEYLPERDYDGVEFLEKGGFWMQKQHIFLAPFYYIDYALAQMNAMELFARYLEDREKAFSDYLALCKRGGSIGYFELLESANLSNSFEEGTVEKVAKRIFDEIEEMGKRLS